MLFGLLLFVCFLPLRSVWGFGRFFVVLFFLSGVWKVVFSGDSLLLPFFPRVFQKVVFPGLREPTFWLVVVSLLPPSRHYWLDADSRLFLPRTCKAIKYPLGKFTYFLLIVTYTVDIICFIFVRKKSVESVLSLIERLSARHCWLEAPVFVGLFVTAICYFFKVSAIILRFYGFFLVITDTFFLFLRFFLFFFNVFTYSCFYCFLCARYVLNNWL